MNDKSKRILVTGGSGFVGSYIIRYLLKNNYDNIVTFTRQKNHPILLSGLENKIEILQGDLFDHDFLDEVTSHCNYLINCAALVSFKPKDSKTLLKTNVEGVSNIINISLKNKVERLIHISSIAALGRSEEEKSLDEYAKWENSKYNSPYAISKYLSELEVWRGFAEGLNGAILNPSLIIGAGKWSDGTNEFFEQIYKGLKFCPSGSNGFVDVRDVAKMAIALLESEITEQRIICSSENLFYLDFFGQIAKYLNKKPPKYKINKNLSKPIGFLLNIANFFTAGNTNLSSNSLNSSVLQSKYNNTKSKKLLNYSYIPLTQTIEETSRLFLNSKENSNKYGILSLI